MKYFQVMLALFANQPWVPNLHPEGNDSKLMVQEKLDPACIGKKLGLVREVIQNVLAKRLK